MTMTPQQLKTYLQTDPDNLGLPALIAKGAIGGIETLVNQQNADFSASQPLVPLTTLSIWAASSSVRYAIEQNLNNSNPQVASICLTLRDLFQGLSGPALDLSSTANQQMAQALVQANVMSTAQLTSLLALADVSPASSLEKQFGKGTAATAQQIVEALNS